MLSEREAHFRTRTLGAASAALWLTSLFAFGTAPAFYVGAIIPWIAVWVYRGGEGAIYFFLGKGDRRPEITHTFIFSSMAAAIVAIGSRTPPLRWDFLIAIGLAVGGLLTAIMVYRNKWHWVGILTLLAWNTLYGASMAAALNQDLDSQPSQTHAAQVLKKKTGRSRSGDLFYFTLGPWGSRASSTEILVGRWSYDNITVGGVFCIDLHPGALGTPWFETKPCQQR